MEDKELLHEEAAEVSETEGASAEGVESGTREDAAELKNRLAYLMAEFDNFRKRAAREREAQAAYGNEKLLLALLPSLDNMERAMSQADAPVDAILSGIRMTYDLLLSDLGKFGLEQVSSEGKLFDPSLHEAVGAVPVADAPEGAVLSESRKGYLLNGRLLRPAHVLVAAAQQQD